MVLERLGNSLRGAIEKISKALFVDKKLVNELIKDLQRALIEADVNIQLVMEVSERIRKRMFEEGIPSTVTKRDYLLRVVYQELIALMGKEEKRIEIKKKPTVVMLVGLFGSGKTTTAGKLANYYKKRGIKVALLQTDTYRPAAYEQLQQLAKKVGVEFYGDKKEKDPVKIYQKFRDKLNKYELVVLDTAGRDALSKELIEEIRRLTKEVKPDERLLVISADIGQAAQAQAEEFHKSCNITGVIATKMDGSAKGGGALTACAATGTPIVFIGVGEKLGDIELFRPKNFVGRLLGMGDLETLLEKTEEAISKEQAEDLSKRLLKGEFNLLDLYEQMSALRKMGPLNKIMELIPGMSKLKLPKEMLETQEEVIEKWKHMMNSMTKEELENPEVINSSRVERIAKGSGTTPTEVRHLIKQYKKTKKLMKMLKGGPASSEKKLQKMMKRFGLSI
ncbi:signal recognition particle protein [Candidatus Woesearchaeota archaeon]|nr:signal recognition particle protein Srp54 [Candidatus Woesearchaeota archaeon]RLE42882.1 MAG: signal recognition particle protein [Candidatus Woesearchaeota archaeon]